MSDTPLTDAEVKKVVGLPQPVDFDLMATHARRLEKALKVAEEALFYWLPDESWMDTEYANRAAHEQVWIQWQKGMDALSTIAKLKEEA